MKRHHLVAMAMAVVAAQFGCGSTTARPEDAASPPSSAAMQSAPPSSASTSASQAFADGYRAYQSHDLAKAVERLGYASEHYPRLGDYALFYCALAERDSGDLAAASNNLEKLIRVYPESVTIQIGRASCRE